VTSIAIETMAPNVGLQSDEKAVMNVAVDEWQ